MAVPPPPVEEVRSPELRDHVVTIPSRPPLRLAWSDDDALEKTQPFIPVFDEVTAH